MPLLYPDLLGTAALHHQPQPLPSFSLACWFFTDYLYAVVFLYTFLLLVT